MKLVNRLVVVIGLLIFASITVIDSRAASASSAPQAQLIPMTSAEYTEALRTANAFLWSWVTRDPKAGIDLMSNALRAKANDDSWLKLFMVGLSNPHHQAFEIGKGQRVGPDRYVFPVTLYELYTGETAAFAYSGTLEIIKQGKDWRINKLPKSSDNP